MDKAKQLSFLDGPIAAPARADSPPQVEAAEAVRPHVPGQCRQILRALLAHGPMSREELCQRIGMKERSACGRLREMEEPGRHMPALCAQGPLVAKIGRQPAHSRIRVWIYTATAAGMLELQRYDGKSP